MTQANFFRILALVAAALLVADLASAEAVLAQLSGQVEVGRGEPAIWSEASTGDIVAANDRIRTGANGRVEIKMDAGTLRVHENSMLRLPPPVGDADQVELNKGRSLFDVLRRGGRRFEVHTPTVVVSVKGTRFEVDAGDDVGEVNVFRGTVGVREVGAAAAMETLVREGFLATGGAGIPIELDVSDASDPWKNWQEFDRALNEDRKRTHRLGEMERAKATLYRSTEADVIVKAAERRPEIAARLSQLQKKQRAKAARESREESNREAPVPAAPFFDGDAPGEPMEVENSVALSEHDRADRIDEMRERAAAAKEVIDAARTETILELEGGFADDGSVGGLANGTNLVFDYAAVYALSPNALLLVRDALLELQETFGDTAPDPTSGTYLLTELKHALILRGMTLDQALETIKALTGG